MSLPLQRRTCVGLAITVVLGAFLFYVATIAPGVTWGDSAKLATMTSPLKLTVEAGCHTLRNLVGSVFNLLPWGDVAFRQNVMSAFFGAVSCLLTFLSVRLCSAGILPAFCCGGGTAGWKPALHSVGTAGWKPALHSVGTAGWKPALHSAATLPDIAGLCSAAALCVSHVFWHVSVITESYTLFVALLATIFYLLARHATGSGNGCLYLAGLLLGLSYINSVLMFALTPALVVLAALGRRSAAEQTQNAPPGGQAADGGSGPEAQCRDRARGMSGVKKWSVAALMVVLGYAPMAAIFVSMLRENSFGKLIGLLFDWRYSGSLFFYQPMGCLKGCAKYVVIMFYQFPLLGFVFGCVGAVICARRDWRTFVPLALIIAPIVLFTSTYMEQRRYYIMVGSFWVFAVWVGVGAAYLLERWVRRAPAWRWHGHLAHDSSRAERPCHRRPPSAVRCAAMGLTLGLLLLAVPIGLYYNMTGVCRTLGVKPLGSTRTLVYRDNEKFFLVPDKRGCDGAERFAREALAVVPEGGVIVADFTPGAVLGYFQTVEGLRKDVRVVSVEGRDMLEYVDRVLPERPIFIVGGHAAYEEDKLQSRYFLLPVGPIFQVVKR